MSIFLIGAISLGIALLAGVIALMFISGGAREEARRIYRLLDERYSRLENDLRRTQDERSEAQQEARRLENASKRSAQRGLSGSFGAQAKS